MNKMSDAAEYLLAKDFDTEEIHAVATAYLALAAKAESVTIDREALIERMAEVSAVSRYNYVNFGKHWDNLSETEQEGWMQQERRRMTTLVDDVVIAHIAAQSVPQINPDAPIPYAGRGAEYMVNLAAQPVTGTVEWGIRFPSGYVSQHPNEESARRDQQHPYALGSGPPVALVSRTASEWVEVN